MQALAERSCQAALEKKSSVRVHRNKAAVERARGRSGRWNNGGLAFYGSNGSRHSSGGAPGCQAGDALPAAGASPEDALRSGHLSLSLLYSSSSFSCCASSRPRRLCHSLSAPASPGRWSCQLVSHAPRARSRSVHEARASGRAALPPHPPLSLPQHSLGLSLSIRSIRRCVRLPARSSHRDRPSSLPPPSSTFLRACLVAARQVRLYLACGAILGSHPDQALLQPRTSPRDLERQRTRGILRAAYDPDPSLT